AYYQSHKGDFERFVEAPVQGLLLRIAARLPLEMAEHLETEKRLFAKFSKNDYGKGGAWDYYWGALYSKGGKRIAAPQLFLWINRDVLRFGFAIGDQGSSYKSRFAKRAAENGSLIAQALGEQLKEIGVKFGSAYHGAAEANHELPTGMSFAEFLSNAEAGDYTAAVSMHRSEVLGADIKDLEDRIFQAFQLLFPLVRLAAEDAAIAEILEVEEGDERAAAPIAPPYSLEQFSADTGIDRDTLEMWTRAIERKGQ